MSYVYLGAAIVCEIGGTTAMKLSDGFTKALPSALTMIMYAVCFVFMSIAIKEINLGQAYATWAGLGIMGATILSVFVFQSKIGLIEVLAIALIIIGVVLLNLFGSAH